jgi:catechol 2,3-dioxygenase-like lactoylglutathione lyase family enzyme
MNLNLLVLRCRHLEKCRAFYELLGFRFIEHSHGSGPNHFAGEIADFVFELYPAPSSEYVDQTGTGFSTDDLSAIHQRLTQGGYQPGSIKQNPWGLTFVVRDPDGRRVEIKGRDRPVSTRCAGSTIPADHLESLS